MVKDISNLALELLQYNTTVEKPTSGSGNSKLRIAATVIQILKSD